MQKIIAPSLLSANFLKLHDEIKVLDSQEDLWLHLDIMDGHFVPNLTFGSVVVKNLSKITSLPLDAHFMVTNPIFFAETFRDVNLHNFTFHWEACSHQDRTVELLKKLYPSVGIALNPATPIHLIPDYIYQKIDLVLLMTVNPGFGGQAFIDGCLGKVKELAHKKEQLSCNFVIQVDGGINEKNAKALFAAGANCLVAGSYIFSQDPKNYINQINKLKNL